MTFTSAAIYDSNFTGGCNFRLTVSNLVGNPIDNYTCSWVYYSENGTQLYGASSNFYPFATLNFSAAQSADGVSAASVKLDPGDATISTPISGTALFTCNP